MSTIVPRTLAAVLPCAIVLTVTCGLVAAAEQQQIRAAANDPQVQLAEDAASRLSGGATPADVIPPGAIEIATSLAPFVAVNDASGHVVATNGSLDGGPPTPPPGVLTAAQQTGRDQVTWQPRAGVRIALVAVPWSNGTVISGRSLRLVEDRVDALVPLIFAAWLLGIVALTAVGAAAAWISQKPDTIRLRASAAS